MELYQFTAAENLTHTFILCPVGPVKLWADFSKSANAGNVRLAAQ